MAGRGRGRRKAKEKEGPTDDDRMRLLMQDRRNRILRDEIRDKPISQVVDELRARQCRADDEDETALRQRLVRAILREYEEYVAIVPWNAERDEAGELEEAGVVVAPGENEMQARGRAEAARATDGSEEEASVPRRVNIVADVHFADGTGPLTLAAATTTTATTTTSWPSAYRREADRLVMTSTAHARMAVRPLGQPVIYGWEYRTAGFAGLGGGPAVSFIPSARVPVVTVTAAGGPPLRTSTPVSQSSRRPAADYDEIRRASSFEDEFVTPREFAPTPSMRPSHRTGRKGRAPVELNPSTRPDVSRGVKGAQRPSQSEGRSEHKAAWAPRWESSGTNTGSDESELSESSWEAGGGKTRRGRSSERESCVSGGIGHERDA